MKVHPITGEVIDPRPARAKESYLYLLTGGISRMLDNHLTQTDYRVLFAVWERAPMDGHPWDTAPALLSERLGVHVTDVHKSLRRLVEMGLIERPARGKVGFVRLVAWRGTLKPGVE